MRRVSVCFLPLFSFWFLAFPSIVASAQQGPTAPRILQAVDENKVVVLKGNTHRLARPSLRSAMLLLTYRWIECCWF